MCIKNNKNLQSMMDKNTFDMIGFSADNNTKIQYHKVRNSRDGSITVVYDAPVTLGVKEMKTSFTLARQCIDDEGLHIAPSDDIPNAITTTVSLRDMARFITSRTTINERKGIFSSLVRISDMSIKITKGETSKIATRWIFQVKTEDNYETAEVILSKTFISLIINNGIGFNLSELIKYNGRTALMYALIQGYKYQRDKNKWYYFDYIPHNMIVQGLDLISQKKMHQVYEIRKAFKEIGLSYYFNKKEMRWEKLKKSLALK